MKIYPSLIFLLLVGYLGYAQEFENKTPGIHEYVPVESEPTLINFEKVRREIGYPINAIKAKIEGGLYCRVLVDTEGNYENHSITYGDHPFFNKAVNEHVNKLKFIPAKQDNKPVKYWINVPFYFSLNDKSLFRPMKMTLWKSLIQSFQSSQTKAQTYLSEGLDYLDIGEYAEAAQKFTQSIAVNPAKKKRDHPSRETLFLAYFAKGKALMNLGKWSESATYFTEAAGIALTEKVLSQDMKASIAEMHADRGLAFYYMKAPLRAIDEYNWVLKTTDNPRIKSMALNRRGLAFLKLGKHQEALTDIEDALEISPNQGCSYYYKGLILLDLGGEQSAEENFKLAKLYGFEKKEQDHLNAFLSQN